MLRPTAKEVNVLDNYVLSIKFDNGEIRLFDAKSLLSRKPFMPLKDEAIFLNCTSQWYNNRMG